MDAFVLLFTLAILLALGMPVAFAVGLSAVAGALWIDLPLEALMIQITSGVNKFTLLAIRSLSSPERSWLKGHCPTAG